MKSETYAVGLGAVQVPNQILVDLWCGWRHHLVPLAVLEHREDGTHAVDPLGIEQ